MAEKFVRASVADNVKDVVETSLKALNIEGPRTKNGIKGEKVNPHKGIVEAIIRGVATRIVLAHSFKDLGNTLDGALSAVKAGGMNETMLDQIKGRVLDRVKDIKDNREGEAVGKFLEEQFKAGKYEEAVALLKKMVEDPVTGLSNTEKIETVGLLGKIKKEADTSPEELGELLVENNKLHTNNQEKTKIIIEKSDKIQADLGSEELIIKYANNDVEKVETKRRVGDVQRDLVIQELNDSANLNNKDSDFIANILVRDPEIDFLTMDRKTVFHVWYRTSGILGEKTTWNGAEQTREVLQQMNESARAAILSFAAENLELEKLTPSEAKWNSLPKGEQDLINRNLRYIENTRGDFRALLEDQEGREFEYQSRSSKAMTDLFAQYDVENPDFDLRGKLVLNQRTKKYNWVGHENQSKQEKMKDFYDVCRKEVVGIQGGLTQENMSNLIFEETAQKYLALMRIDVGDDLELERVKDAITKNLYIEFAVKTMWRSGGNMEAWQRAAMVITQDSEINFFQLMEIGEQLKIKNEEGKDVDVGRFDWRDLMTLAETRADNGQYFLTYMGGASSALQQERKPKFAAALAELVLNKRLAKGEISQGEFDELKGLVGRGKEAFHDRQVKSMVDYMQFLEVATFRGGEFGLNDSSKGAIEKGKMNLTSLPCGEVVHKTGPWALIYDWYYPVTKYGGEAIGKVFLPNVNILSYRRGETLAHFVAKDSKTAAGMLDKTGEYQETGTGAKEFFFDDIEYKAVDKNGEEIYKDENKKAQFTENELWTRFWGDVIFDTRTAQYEGMTKEQREMAGVNEKTAVNRTVEMIKERGKIKLNDWDKEGKLEFIKHLNFENFETMLGYKIPKNTNREKFEWMINNFDYSFWRVDTLPSKAVGDWVTKYVPKKYEEARLKLIDYMNSPGLATLGAVRNIVAEYSSESTVNGQLHDFLKHNRKTSTGLKLVDENGHEEGTPGYEKEKNPKWKLVGYKDADREKSKWIQEGAGDYWMVTEQWHAITEGYHWGSGLPTSRQKGKELFRDPMYFEKMELDNQFHAGMLSRKEWGQAKREWQKKAYFGELREFMGIKFRLGYFPPLLPFLLIRGWWVDQMQLDWQDFKIAFRKNNEETWEKLKKILGL